MTTTTTGVYRTDGTIDCLSDTTCSPISWPAIFAGGVAAIAVTLILLLVGSGLGLATSSPWSDFSATSMTTKTIIWLIIMQWGSAALGGYLAGRLRPAPVRLHADEVYFRDTAQGFMAWCVATVFMVALTAGVTTSVVSGAAQSATVVAAGAAAGAASNSSEDPASMYAYDIDSLFRTAVNNAPVMMADGTVVTAPNRSGNTADRHAQALRILLNNLGSDEAMPVADRDYLASVVAAETGLSEPEALQRVEGTRAVLAEKKQQAMEAADTARKASATFALLTAVSMLLGAFIASIAAVMGGMHRTLYPAPRV